MTSFERSMESDSCAMRGLSRKTGGSMGRTTTDDYDAVAQSTAWIADATRSFAGLGGATDPAEDHAIDPRWGGAGSALDQLRASIAHHIAALPRQGRVIDSVRPGVGISHLAVSKLLTWQLAGPAAAAAAAVADVEVRVDARTVSAVHIHLVAVGADPRDQTYLQDGDSLRDHAARAIAEILGATPHITVMWEDIALPPSE